MKLFHNLGFFAARFSCGILFLFTLLAYKIRRWHLSMYDDIEEFLQIQNNCMPIRYSYRDLKNMTKNFKDKLGEGGYGTVFKDVYSFGILLMEMASERRNLNPSAENISQIYFPCWVHDIFSKGMEIDLGDASLDERIMVKKMTLVALWCIQMKPDNRPSMTKVLEMLEGDVKLLQLPPMPYLSPEEMPDSDIDMNDREFPLFSGSFD
ncbi:rust resistance kinase Lr10-like [Olea europaea subsp. europaea]|uniref:Rust resistance kinase Lr10-like n=1 Tax=Olea europaea subsp. europaea TaxID=158383 RepID=A0A8S0UI93_OLEEU|nr:rust resistance kinase Lr10-like [Olea europaea subsp. europaea]